MKKVEVTGGELNIRDLSENYYIGVVLDNGEKSYVIEDDKGFKVVGGVNVYSTDIQDCLNNNKIKSIHASIFKEDLEEFLNN
jgi:hypothetical protein